jgi:hypothetical protein
MADLEFFSCEHNSEKTLLTIHKVGKIDEIPPFFGISIRQETPIGQFPPEYIRYEDDHSLWCALWARNVRLQAMDGGNCASRSSALDKASEAIRAGDTDTGHLCDVS